MADLERLVRHLAARHVVAPEGHVAVMPAPLAVLAAHVERPVAAHATGTVAATDMTGLAVAGPAAEFTAKSPAPGRDRSRPASPWDRGGGDDAVGVPVDSRGAQ